MIFTYGAKVSADMIVGSEISLNTDGTDVWVVTDVIDLGPDEPGVNLRLERPSE